MPSTLSTIEPMKYLITLVLSLGCLFANAQIRIDVVSGLKERYSSGDRLVVCITVKSQPQTCLSGMKQTKLYTAGCQATDKTDWREVGKGLFSKDVEIVIQPGKKSVSKLTVLRATDKENLFAQQVFNLQI